MKLLRVLICLACLCALLVQAPPAQADRPPNIVVILADDLGCCDMALYDGWVKTPNLDRMAREGLRFTDFHSNSSVCSPTRTAFLTGRYQQRAGVVDVIVGDREPDHGIPAGTKTVADIFQDNGYTTALFGKWHCGYQDQYNPTKHGFDEFIGFLNGGTDYHRRGGWRKGLDPVQAMPGYGTRLITERGVDFIKRHKDKPFFLYLAHQAVHNPYHTPADTPENRDKGEKWNAINDANRARYKVILEELDKGVGQVLDTLKEQGLAENTLVFFFSDNGAVPMSPAVFRKLRGGKFSQYEGGHRVPAIAWWPGKVKPGTTTDELVAGFDLFPTFTEIAGIADDNPNNLDGQSAKGLLLEGKAMPARDLFFGYEPKLGTALRRGDWKMIVKEDDVQLYNLKNDLYETTNIADQHPEVVKPMRDAIEHFKATVTAGS